MLNLTHCKQEIFLKRCSSTVPLYLKVCHNKTGRQPRPRQLDVFVVQSIQYRPVGWLSASWHQGECHGDNAPPVPALYAVCCVNGFYLYLLKILFGGSNCISKFTWWNNIVLIVLCLVYVDVKNKKYTRIHKICIIVKVTPP
jgi:hypothetical protein